MPTAGGAVGGRRFIFVHVSAATQFILSCLNIQTYIIYRTFLIQVNFCWKQAEIFLCNWKWFTCWKNVHFLDWIKVTERCSLYFEACKQFTFMGWEFLVNNNNSNSTILYILYIFWILNICLLIFYTCTFIDIYIELYICTTIPLF